MPEARVGPPELFVYYRVPQAAEAEACHAVATLHQALRAAHPGLQARLMRRPELRDGELTFMETYARADGGIDAPLQAAIEAAALALSPWISGARHSEVFLPCA